MQRILEVIIQVFAGATYPVLLHTLEDCWIYKLTRAASQIEQSQYKLSKLVHLCLQVLQQISQTRLQQQVLQFLKTFREFSDEFDISFVGFNGSLLEPKFKRLF